MEEQSEQGARAVRRPLPLYSSHVTYSFGQKTSMSTYGSETDWRRSASAILAGASTSTTSPSFISTLYTTEGAVTMRSKPYL